MSRVYQVKRSEPLSVGDIIGVYQWSGPLSDTQDIGEEDDPEDRCVNTIGVAITGWEVAVKKRIAVGYMDGSEPGPSC